MSELQQSDPASAPELQGLPTDFAQTPQPRRSRDPRNYSEWDPRSAPGTYFLMAINILVFLWMTFHGVSITRPTTPELLHFGANDAILVLNGQWYRLVTAIFVHVGLLHIATNMWCLWNLGLLGEPLLGPLGIVAVYLLTGVAGNLLSVAWDVLRAMQHNEPLWLWSVPGAGASGAVFGIAGILIILLSNRRLPIPWSELQRLRTSVVRFAGINLVIGAGTILFATPIRVDNSAHIGGFLSGLALGPGLVSQMTAGRTKYLNRQKLVFLAAAFVLSLVGYWLANFK
jgi:rhomboid protease GluP